MVTPMVLHRDLIPLQLNPGERGMEVFSRIQPYCVCCGCYGEGVVNWIMLFGSPLPWLESERMNRVDDSRAIYLRPFFRGTKMDGVSLTEALLTPLCTPPPKRWVGLA